MTTTHTCGLLDRRLFLRRAAVAVGAALMLDGLAAGDALAESVRAMTPVTKGARTRTYAIPAVDGVSVDAADGIALARWKGKLYAFSLECPHKGADLQWREGEQQLYCPKHKARFSPDGAHVSGRMTRDLDRFGLVRQGPNVVLALDQRLSSTAAGWTAAVLTL